MNDYFNNMMNTNFVKESIDKIIEFTKMDMFGIRNRKSNKFIYIGLLGDRILYCDRDNVVECPLWSEENDAKTVYDAMCKYDEHFNENYFIDKCNEDEMSELPILEYRKWHE